MKLGRAFALIRALEDDGDDELIVRGLASAENLDRKGTRIDQNSVWEASKKFTHRTLFWQHDWDMPVGRVEKMERSDDGLVVEARIGRDYEVPRPFGANWSVNNLRRMIEQRIVNAFSIGFAADEIPEDERDGGKEAPDTRVTDFFDISTVTVPANERTIYERRSFIFADEIRPPKQKERKTLFEFVESPEDDESMYAELSDALRALRGSIVQD